MARLRRKYDHNGVYLVGNRVAEGLPFAANLYINFLLFGILARAQFMYPGITVCAWLFMGNHYHGLVVLRSDAKRMMEFMRYVDGEIAKLVNRLRGVSNKNVWASRHDATRLLTPEAVIDKLVYIFMNPVRAFLVAKIKQYPGASTLREFLGKHKKPRTFKWISSSKVQKLKNQPFVKRYLKACLASIQKLELRANPLVISPFAWKDCFEASLDWSDEWIREQVLEQIQDAEQEIAEERKRKGIQVVGTDQLKLQSFFKRFRPSSYGRRSICISTCLELRAQFIEEYRAFCLACEEAWKSWRRGDFSANFPPGAFRPVMPPTASAVSF